MDIKLDYDAIGRILKETCAPVVHQLAAQIAESVRGNGDLPEGASVSVKDFVTDRAVSVILVGHPDASAIQAKHGILTSSAAAAGLEVTAR